MFLKISQKTINHAFTLIELLVVIAIIGILSGLIIVGMNSSVRSATVAKAQIFSSSLRDSLLMNLVSEWRFEGLTAIGSVASVTDAVDTWGSNGATTVSATVRGGSDCIYGKCLSFGGSADFINLGNNNSLNIGSYFTISAWVKVSAITNYHYIYESSFSGSGIEDQLMFRICGGSGDGRLYLRSGDGTNQVSLSSGYRLDDSKWHYVVGTYDGGVAKIYDNAAQAGSQIVSIIPKSNNRNRYIGSYQGFSYFFNGYLDEIRLFNAAIPSSQIKDYYYSGLNRLVAKGEFSITDYWVKLGGLSKSLASKD